MSRSMEPSETPDSQKHETHKAQTFPQDTAFFARLQQHDTAAWEEVLRLYALPLRRDIVQALLRRSLPLEWADDLEQQTWVTAIRLIENFVWESEDTFYTWFRSIATFHIKNRARKLKKVYVSLEEIDEDLNDTGLSLDFFLYIQGLMEDGPETQLALRESFTLIDQAMPLLKPHEREILLRRVLYNESVQHMAKEYGVKPEIISVILVRTKQVIREHIARLQHDDTTQGED
jgi:RNA polymerase sigma factor (sigma-70 family)